MRTRKTLKVQATLLQGLDLEQLVSALKIAKLKKRMLKPVGNARLKKLEQKRRELLDYPEKLQLRTKKTHKSWPKLLLLKLT